MLDIFIHFFYINIRFVASCSGGLVYSLVICTTWAGAPVALGPWGARSILCRVYLLFFILAGATNLGVRYNM